jgi:hypothetical protein
MEVKYTGVNSADVIGIRGISKPVSHLGIGGWFEGGRNGVRALGTVYGVESIAETTGSAWTYGVHGTANSNDITARAHGVYGLAHATAGQCYGVYGKTEGNQYSLGFGLHGEAVGTAAIRNIGVYGNATGAPKNWAGYFDLGDVYVRNMLAIGHLNPVVSIDVINPQAVIKLMSEINTSGSVLELRNSSNAPTLLGAINFGTLNTTPGQIAYTNGNELTFRVNSTERMRINSSGLMGIGRTPVTNRLEVEGNASKSSAGDWIANSDKRLKKNIEPLDAQEMIEKLLTLQGVTYEWNDDKTGSSRPAGMQYGFTAQNIQEAFPTLVEEDTLGYLQTAYGTYDAMMVEAIRFLHIEIHQLKEELNQLNNR